MADQTSAFISVLGLGRVDVLGWSLGGMVARLWPCSTLPRSTA
jgi:pimeloyl-ACP methyl ester carboxylesterase